MKNILLPTDFSENAWNAVRYAVKLLANEQCVFHLLNTYTPAIPTSRFMGAALPSGTSGDGARIYSESGLERLIDRIAREYPNPRHSYRSLSSFCLLTDAVKTTVEQEEIDLIILGTKGASGMEEVFMGSNAVRVIKSVKQCPILVVPHEFAYQPPSEIAFATDFNRFYSESELRPLIELARIFRATLRIVHVQYELRALSEVQHFNLNMLRKYVSGIEFYIHTVSEMNSISHTLETFVAELDIHLLAMLHYQHSYMERMTREPVVKRVAFHTQVPLLVIPELGMHRPHVRGTAEVGFSNSGG